MKTKVLILICLIISLCGCAGAKQKSNDASNARSTVAVTKNDRDDKKFPSFSIPLEDGTNLNTGKLSKPTFVNIWATWCGYCIVEMPYLDELCAEYKGKVDFILVDGNEPKKMVDDFIKENFPIRSFKIGYDERGDVVKALGLMGFPTSYLIKSDGTVVEQIIGARSKEAYKKSIENLLAN